MVYNVVKKVSVGMFMGTSPKGSFMVWRRGLRFLSQRDDSLSFHIKRYSTLR